MKSHKPKLLAALTAAALSFTALSLPVSANSRGDVDGDGKITLNDAYQALMAYANESAGRSSGLTSSQESAADVDHSGSLTMSDAYQILMYYAMESAGKSPSWDNLPTFGAQMKTWKDLYREFLESEGYVAYVSPMTWMICALTSYTSIITTPRSLSFQRAAFTPAPS